MSHRLWPVLEDMPGAEAVLAEWQFRLGSDFRSVRSLLRPTDQEAGCYPGAPDDILPYRIVKHSPDDYVGVPPDGGEAICLRHGDVLVYRLDHRKLAKEIAVSLGFEPSFSEVQGLPTTWRIGSVAAPRGNHRPVHLVLPSQLDDLRWAIEAIAAQNGESGVVIVPTPRFKPASETLLRLTNGWFIAMSDVVLGRDRGRWIVDPAVGDVIASFVVSLETVVDDPLSDRCQMVLVAMCDLNAFDSDHRQSTESIAIKALGETTDPNALKGVMAELKSRKHIRTKTGRNGGCWLTKRGRLRASKLRQLVETPQPF